MEKHCSVRKLLFVFSAIVLRVTLGHFGETKTVGRLNLVILVILVLFTGRQLATLRSPLDGKPSHASSSPSMRWSCAKSIHNDMVLCGCIHNFCLSAGRGSGRGGPERDVA